jgi:hypothetical protein
LAREEAEENPPHASFFSLSLSLSLSWSSWCGEEGEEGDEEESSGGGPSRD